VYSVEIVADDLTGAMDTSQGFATRGYATTVVADPDAEIDAIMAKQDAAVLGVNTDSRYADEKHAIENVREITKNVPTQAIYKKVDSTLRGNFATEVDAVLTASGAALALVAPAFPSANRTTENGIHYVSETPVAETEYGSDPKGPNTSSIADLFGIVDRSIENIPIETVEAGGDKIASVLADTAEQSERAPILVCDASNSNHLETIAEAAADFDALYVGSGGLAKHVPVLQADADAPSPLQLSTGAALGVVGSVSSDTFDQLDRISNEAVVSVDGASLVGGDSPIAAVERAIQRLQEDRPVILTAASDNAAVERTLASGQELGLTSVEIREQVATGLARAATGVLREGIPSGLLLTGGDIAVATIRELGATAITLTGHEVEAGIPIGIIADGDTSGMAVVTKAGGFGSKETIANCLESLTQTNE
jgi:uncharacterized protein YgbK (DUF1537 family)